MVSTCWIEVILLFACIVDRLAFYLPVVNLYVAVAERATNQHNEVKTKLLVCLCSHRFQFNLSDGGNKTKINKTLSSVSLGLG